MSRRPTVGHATEQARAADARELDVVTPNGGTEPDRNGSAIQREASGTCRLDKWLWHVRVVKTRVAAVGLVTAGHVRVNANRVDKPGYSVKVGDVVVIVLREGVKTLKIAAFAARRGDAAAAAKLYDDLSPPPPKPDPTDAAVLKAGQAARREAGTGRPTKRDRRLMDRLKYRST